MKNTSADYKGCHIVLTPTQQADGTWGCNTQSLHSDRIAGVLKANQTGSSRLERRRTRSVAKA